MCELCALIYNVINNRGELCLNSWVDQFTAKEALDYYNMIYRCGEPYPNGKGHYPDQGFRIIRKS